MRERDAGIQGKWSWLASTALWKVIGHQIAILGASRNIKIPADVTA